MKTQAKSFDKILKIRLSEMSMANFSFLSAIIKEFRLQHEPELTNVYLLFSFILALLVGIYVTLKVTRNSIVTFLRKEAVQNARLGDLILRPVDSEGPLSPENTKVLNKLRKKLDQPPETVQSSRTSCLC